MGKNNNQDHINDVMNTEVAKSAAISTEEELRKNAQISDQSAYIIADSFTGNPSLLLGRVIEVRKPQNEECPNSISATEGNFEFSTFSITGFETDEQTKLSKPELRGSFIVDKNISAQIGFLNYLSAQLDAKSTFSLAVMDQGKGQIIQNDLWKKAVKDWINENSDIMNDSNVCWVYVVTGFVQKNIIKKRYVQFETGAKGGAFGINVNGKLSTSTEDYSLDIIFGLTPAIIKRPQQAKAFEFNAKQLEATGEEQTLFAKASGKKVDFRLFKP
jgi:hypothetical protein